MKFHLLEDQHHFSMSQDIEFHFLELPKFDKTLAELNSGLDVWLYFLRNAEKIDEAALPPVLAQPAILRAVEELKMLTQTDIERERYYARRKQQLDHDSAIIGAQELGQQLGQQIGEKIGVIRLCEQLLEMPATSQEQLAAMSLEDLTRLADDLRTRALSKS